MAGYEVGSAFLTVLPSAKGFAGNLSKEIDGPMVAAGRRSGEQLGEGVGKGAKGSFVAAGRTAGGLFAGAFAAVGVLSAVQGVASYISDAIGAASDLSETVNKSGAIFGQNSARIEAWAEGAASSAGLAKGAALDAASGFGNMFTQLGFAADQAADMSVDVVQLSADLGSFNNLPTADVADRISAAFRGEYDSLQLLIPNINAARVEQEAFAMTGKTTTAELTAQEKAAAVLAIAHKDGAAAAGDFAKTSDGLANSQKILQADLENVKAEIGTALLPVALELFTMFRDIGVPVLQDFAAWVTQNKDGIAAFALGTVDAGLMIVDAIIGMMGHYAQMQQMFIIGGTNIIQAWLNVAETIIDSAVTMFGWVPGVGDKLRTVQANFGELRDVADSKFREVRAAADVTVAGFDAARSAVAGIRDTLAEVRDKIVTVTVKANVSDALFQSTPGMYVRAPGRATGGPVTAGRPYIVGEREAELFVPDRPGMIYNQKQIAALGVGGGGDRNININANNYGRPIGTSDLVQAGRALVVLDPDW